MYHLFAYDRFYPSGGMGDYIQSFDHIEDAKKNAETKSYDDYEIVIQRDGDYINPASLEVIETGHSIFHRDKPCEIIWEKYDPIR